MAFECMISAGIKHDGVMGIYSFLRVPSAYADGASIIKRQTGKVAFSINLKFSFCFILGPNLADEMTVTHK